MQKAEVAKLQANREKSVSLHWVAWSRPSVAWSRPSVVWS